MSVTLSPSSQLAFQRTLLPSLSVPLQLPADPVPCYIGPLTQLVKRTLSVSNHNSQPIVYKVKTTAPKQYCVRPNSGRIEPGETVEVQGEFLQQCREAEGASCWRVKGSVEGDVPLHRGAGRERN